MNYIFLVCFIIFEHIILFKFHISKQTTIKNISIYTINNISDKYFIGYNSINFLCV